MGSSRPLLLVLALLGVLTGMLLAGHDHPDADAAPCTLCLASAQAELAPPPEGPVLPVLPLPEPVLRAFTARAATRPAAAPPPPSRAPPLTA